MFRIKSKSNDSSIYVKYINNNININSAIFKHATCIRLTYDTQMCSAFGSSYDKAHNAAHICGCLFKSEPMNGSHFLHHNFRTRMQCLPLQGPRRCLDHRQRDFTFKACICRSSYIHILQLSHHQN